MGVHCMDSWIMESGETAEDNEIDKPASPASDETKAQQKRKTDEIEDVESKKQKQDSPETIEPQNETDQKECVPDNEADKAQPIKNVNQEYDENCYECKQKFKEPGRKDLVMYLHAWSYKVRKYKSLACYQNIFLFFIITVW